MELTPQQTLVRDYPFENKTFLRGEAGTGKTTTAVSRLEKMLFEGIFAESILVLVPQRPLALPYFRAISNPALPPGGKVSILTIGGLARRMDELFWPLICESAGFTHPEIAPQFLTVETTQYFLRSHRDPLREHGFLMESPEPLRLYSQIFCHNTHRLPWLCFRHRRNTDAVRSAFGNISDARFLTRLRNAPFSSGSPVWHIPFDFSLQWRCHQRFGGRKLSRCMFTTGITT